MGLFLFLARLLLASVFIVSSVLKTLGFGAFVTSLKYGLYTAPDTIAETTPIILPFVTNDNATYVAIAVIAIELLGGLILVAGRPQILARLAGLGLAIFTLLAAYYYHQFWLLNAPGQEVLRQLDTILFMKNISIAGGLLLLTFRGPNDDE